MNPNESVTIQPSKGKLWTGRIMSSIAVLFLLFDAVIHTLNPQFVSDAFIQLGYQTSVATPLGILMFILLILFLIPRTSVLGAILLTGYLGGAVATNLRVGAAFFSNVMFPVYVGILIWGGLYLRNQKLREIIPLQK